MKFKFTKNLDYQIEAIDAIAEIFDLGKNIVKMSERFELQSFSPIVANKLDIEQERILKNVQMIQGQNGVEPIERLDSMDFSIEMETGTGKTYVYLRTALELNQKYGLKKFIILVPSVAIREGVLKTIEQTKEHFRELYGNGFGYFAYDSGRLSRVREFAQSLDVQIMIMTIQSFNKDKTIMRQTPDRFNGESPLDLVAQTRPVVIMDEPQNMESELSKSAITDLKPLFKLRYSATHKEAHNLMYRLTPVDAYKKGLVKNIEVFGVKEDNPNELVFNAREIRTQQGSLPKAKVVVEIKEAADEYKRKEMLLKAGDDLFQRTQNEKYAGLLVNEIDAHRGRVELSNGNFYQVEQNIQGDKEAIFRTQIRETIKAHCNKQEELGKGVKVLSLFFIDRVDNYMQHSGVIRRIFEEEFDKIKRNFTRFKESEAAAIHNGYFANIKKKGDIIYQDTDGKSKADKEVYDLIMKNKERLLSFEEPICFIFSHSALREGWDNPNIFQICTLNETSLASKKRQEIGRGLRLAVDINGDRVFDANVNVLTVIANESYQDFASRLQADYYEAGYKESIPTSNAQEKVIVRLRKQWSAENEDFKKLWEKIRKRTKFNIDLDVKKIISLSVDKINELDVQNIVVRVDKVMIDFTDNGKLKTIYEQGAAGERLDKDIFIDNVIERIVRETGITKKTIFDILSLASNINLLFVNPEEYTRSVIVIIKHSLNELLINEGLKYLPTNDVWELSLFEDLKTYGNKTMNSSKSVYEKIIFDSEGERQFAESLNQSRIVKLFAKLPPKFVVDTPLGTYNPDWAIVISADGGEKMYLVRETKFVGDLANLRPSEEQKIACGAKHFKAINVDFKVAQSKELHDLLP